MKNEEKLDFLDVSKIIKLFFCGHKKPKSTYFGGNMKSKGIIKKFVLFFEILLIAYFIMPEIISSAYSVMVADDFAHGTAVGAYHVNPIAYFIASVKYAYHIYMTWQGTYFSMFIQALLSPINNGGLLQLRFVMLANSLLFWFSLFLLINEVCRRINISIYIRLALICLISYLITAYQAYEEIFYWFSGATSYSFPLSIGLLGFVFVIKYNRTGKKYNIVLAAILGFLAMGGSLTVTGFGCYSMLLLCAYMFITKNEKIKGYIVTLIVWLVGAFCNGIAPGNYERHGVIDDSGVHPIKALAQSAMMVKDRLSYFFEGTNFLAVMVLIFICALLIRNKLEIKQYLVISLFGVLAPFVTAFPVALGYSSGDMPNRCMFLVDIAIILTLINLVVTLGLLCNQRMSENTAREPVILSMVVVSFVLFFQNGGTIVHTNSVQILKQITNGTYASHYQECKDFYYSLNTYEEGENVVIRSEDLPAEIPNLYNFYLTDDSTYWVNVAVSDYYKLGSIYVLYVT